MIIQTNKALVRRLYDEVFDSWDLAVVDELVGPDFVGHSMPPETPRGSRGFRQFYGMIRTAFPDLHYSVEDLVAEGDKVVVCWRWHATQG